MSVFSHIRQEPLPIEGKINEIIGAIAKYGTKESLSINAATGSGKTLAIPYFALVRANEIFAGTPRQDKKIRVMVCMPTIISVIKAYGVVSGIPGMEKHVGYSAGGEVRYENYKKSTVSDVIFVTEQHGANRIMNALSNGETMNDVCDILILDEYHMQGIPTLEMNHFWNHFEPENRPVLIKLSATGTANESGARVEVAVGRSAITMKYITEEQEATLGKTPQEIMSNRLQFGIDLVSKARASGYRDNIIFFLPTVGSSYQCKTLMLKNNPNENIIVAHSKMDIEDSKKLNDLQKGDAMTIFSTDLLESSVTVEGVQFVIDLCQRNYVRYDSRGGSSSMIDYVSKNSAIQRAGRTGRIEPGMCYRLMTESNYARLRDHDEPGLVSEDYKIPVIRSIRAKIDPSEMFVDAGLADKIPDIISSLTKSRAIRNSDDPGCPQIGSKRYCSNGLGNFVSTAALDYREGHNLYFMILDAFSKYGGNIYPACACTAALSIGSAVRNEREESMRDNFTESIFYLNQMIEGSNYDTTAKEAAMKIRDSASSKLGTDERLKSNKTFNIDALMDLYSTYVRLSKRFSSYTGKDGTKTSTSIVSMDVLNGLVNKNIYGYLYMEYKKGDHPKSGKEWRVFRKFGKGSKEVKGRINTKNLKNILDKGKVYSVYSFTNNKRDGKTMMVNIQLYYNDSFEGEATLIEESMTAVSVDDVSSHSFDISRLMSANMSVLKTLDPNYQSESSQVSTPMRTVPVSTPMRTIPVPAALTAAPPGGGLSQFVAPTTRIVYANDTSISQQPQQFQAQPSLTPVPLGQPQQFQAQPQQFQAQPQQFQAQPSLTPVPLGQPQFPAPVQQF